jgi:uncharacterized membrane protein
MKTLSYGLTIFTTTILGLGSVYLTPILGLFIFCWQCGTKETNVWLFWPMAYLLALGLCFLFSKLPDKYGGKNFKLAAVTLLALMVGLSFAISI